jgi:hypothetical protein
MLNRIAPTILSLLLAAAALANPKDNFGPVGVFNCGAYPVFEFLSDMDGQFYYRKQVVEWKQGHANTLRPAKLATKRNGDVCTLTVKVGDLTKTYQYKVCAQSERGARCKTRTNTIKDVTKSSIPFDSGARDCRVEYGDKDHDYEDSLAKCIVPKSQTVASKKYIPPACRSTNTGVLIEPYTCSYVTQPELEPLSNYRGKICDQRKVDGICSAKVKCVWNNSIPRAGHVLQYNSYVYCPAIAGRCKMNAMTCGSDASLYFADDEAVQEALRDKYNIPASAK